MPPRRHDGRPGDPPHPSCGLAWLAVYELLFTYESPCGASTRCSFQAGATSNRHRYIAARDDFQGQLLAAATASVFDGGTDCSFWAGGCHIPPELGIHFSNDYMQNLATVVNGREIAG